MNYEIFKEELLQALKDEGIPSKNCTFSTSIKNNGVVIRTLILKDDVTNLAPSINMEAYYKAYCNDTPIREIVQELLEIQNTKPTLPQDFSSFTWDQVKDYVVYTLISYASNLNFLKAVPHIRLLDLVLIFKLDASVLNISGFITITNSLLKHFQINKSDLFTAAYLNTPDRYPLTLLKLNDLTPLVDEDSAGAAKMMPTYYIATNSETNYGASVVLYDEFEELMLKKGITSCYILPSSIHETIIVSTSEGVSRETLESMVSEVNSSSAMNPIDILSSRVYELSELKTAFELIKSSYLEMHVSSTD